ncbi:response regulator transcription factor [Campylobacter sp.]|uniref:response regulator transcription factor n=1 Tax=Campylobacter sp. TaxID=205 RepID=UPI00270D9447|nr:response regulator [Campylobacter sp.]
MTSESLKLLKKLSILIVEDDEISRELLASGLKPYCASVQVAADGCEGLESFKRQRSDIVITDIHMPIMNGFEMMKEISRIKPHQKFIVFTSYDTDINLMKSIEQGAALFLKKPIDIKDLRSMIIALTYEKNEKLTKISDTISINLKEEKIYKNGEEIYLTYLQNKFFWLFAYNLNKLVSYEMIEEFVYENEAVSKGAIQNIILRLKRELGIKFKNISEAGYILIVDENR